MNRIREALTRKLGPLPAWAWLGLFFVGVWYYRNKMSGAASGTGTGSVAPSGPTPGTGEQVLQPGESVYDPTAGTLATAPGGGAANGSNTDNLAASIGSLADAIGAQQGGQQTTTPQVNITVPNGSSGTPKASSKRTAKPKRSTKLKAAAKKVARPRSTARVRNAGGGKARTTAHGGTKIAPNGRTRAANHSAAKAPARQRPKTTAIETVVRQRPVAATQPSHSSGANVQHRPSAPAPRPGPRPGTKSATTKKKR